MAQTTPSSPPADQAALAEGNNAFAIDLYGQLRKQDGNLFFSPESISTALAMAYAGAGGETATEMAATLHYTLPPGRLHPAMGALLANLNAKHAGYQLHMGDALWAEQSYSFLDSFLKVTGADYGAGFKRLDFKGAPEASRVAINQWVAQATEGRITNLIPPSSVHSTTRLVLTNAISFKGDWDEQFDKGLTQVEDFHLSPSQAVKVAQMHRSGGFNYFDGGTFQVLDIPYKANALSMIVLLPNDVGGLPALEQSLTPANVHQWLSQWRHVAKVILTMPKFKMTREFELASTLGAMGMAQAFQPDGADFSAMTGKRDLWISAVLHKAFVDVNEEGTEAAAATGVVVLTRMIAREDPPIVFRADHPFIFLIRENRSNAILFMGRVSDPTK